MCPWPPHQAENSGMNSDRESSARPEPQMQTSLKQAQAGLGWDGCTMKMAEQKVASIILYPSTSLLSAKIFNHSESSFDAREGKQKKPRNKPETQNPCTLF